MNNPIDKSDMFYGREDELRSFREKYDSLAENIKNNTDPKWSVMTFWGIDGAGKSALRSRMENEIDCVNVCLNFDDREETVYSQSRILGILRNKFERKYGFTFTAFDHAYRAYKYLSGGKYDEEEKNSDSFILEKHTVAKSAVEFMQMVPGLDKVSAAIQGTDTLLGALFSGKKRRKAYKEELARIDGIKDEDRLYDNLYYWFLFDVQMNLDSKKYSDKPVVIFLDSYDRFSAQMSSNKKIKDDWLRRGENSFIRNSNGFLWVILGRDPLTWDKDEDIWKSKEYLDQNELKGLSQNETIACLHDKGISDEYLCNALYKKFRGLPICLAPVIRIYNLIDSQGKRPEIGDFPDGIEGLMDRYVQTLPDAQIKLGVIFSVVGKWNDEIMEILAPVLKDKRIDDEYDEFCSNSFVCEENDEKYIYAPVRNTFLRYESESGKNFRKELYPLLAPFFTEKIYEAGCDNYELLRYIEFALYEGSDYEECYEDWHLLSSVFFGRVLYENESGEILNLLNKLYEKTNELFPNTCYSLGVRNVYAWALNLCGHKNDVERLLEDDNVIPLDYDMEYLISLNLVTGIYIESERFEDAIRVGTDCLKGITSLADKENAYDLSALSDAYENLAKAYGNTGNAEKADELYKKAESVFEKAERMEQDNIRSALGDDFADDLDDLNKKISDGEVEVETMEDFANMLKELCGDDFDLDAFNRGDYDSEIIDCLVDVGCSKREAQTFVVVLHEDMDYERDAKEERLDDLLENNEISISDEHFEEIMGLIRELYGEDIERVYQMTRVAEAFRLTGDDKKAVSVLDDALDILQKEYRISDMPEENEEYESILRQIACLYSMSGNNAKAKDVCEKIMENEYFSQYSKDTALELLTQFTG